MTRNGPTALALGLSLSLAGAACEDTRGKVIYPSPPVQQRPANLKLGLAGPGAQGAAKDEQPKQAADDPTAASRPGDKK
jgi:hypothetical protein